MAKIVFVFVCVALFQIASALDCYSCSGPSCETETKTWDKKTCGSSGITPAEKLKWACLKSTYKDAATQKKVVERKCVLSEMKDGKPNFQCQRPGSDQSDCQVCQVDFCNSASSLSYGLVASIGVALAVLAPKLL